MWKRRTQSGSVATKRMTSQAGTTVSTPERGWRKHHRNGVCSHEPGDVRCEEESSHEPTTAPRRRERQLEHGTISLRRYGDGVVRNSAHNPPPCVRPVPTGRLPSSPLTSSDSTPYFGDLVVPAPEPVLSGGPGRPFLGGETCGEARELVCAHVTSSDDFRVLLGRYPSGVAIADGRRGRPEARAHRRIARIPLARPTARRIRDLERGRDARAAARSGRLRDLTARRRAGVARAALRPRRPPDRDVARHRDGARGGRCAAPGRRARMARSARFERRSPAGTHTFFVCAVERVELGEDVPPLVRLRGEYRSEQRDRGRRLRPRRRPRRLRARLGRGARGARARARRTLARARAGRHDGHELARVVALHARRHRARGVAGGRSTTRSSRRLLDRYARGAAAASTARSRRCERLAGSFRLALASSSNRPGHRRRPRGAGLAQHFEATVSSEEVARGKPAPDVFLEAARRLGVAPERCAAIEDSGNGIRAAHAAGMRVVAIPNRRYPPADEALDAGRRRAATRSSSSTAAAAVDDSKGAAVSGPFDGHADLSNVRCLLRAADDDRLTCTGSRDSAGACRRCRTR